LSRWHDSWLRIPSLCVLGGALALATACGSAAPAAPSSPPAKAGGASTAPAATSASSAAGGQASTYTIPAVLEVTGAAAFLGKEEQQALQVYAKSINAAGGIDGHPLAFAVQDDQSSPSVALQEVDGLLAKHVPVILGPSLVADCAAVEAAAQQAHVVDYCLSPGIHPATGSYVFSGSASTDALAQSALTYFRSQGWTRVGVITSSDATGQDAQRALKAAMALPANSGSLRIVANEQFDPTSPDVTAQLVKIKAANPQVLIAWTTGTPISTVFKGVVSTGLNVPVYTTDGNQTYAEMHAFAQFLPKALYFSSPAWAAESLLPAGAVRDAVQGFYKAFAATGAKPDVGQSLAWDPAELVVAAVQKFGVGMTAQQLHGYLEQLTNAPGINGPHNFVKYPQRGLSADNAYVVRWSASQDTWVPVSGPGGGPLPAGH
jgi:branched-chain amino acid transport system substrate-binding protein